MKRSLRVVTEKKICDRNSEGLTEGQSKPKGQQKNKALLKSEDMLRTRVVTKLQAKRSLRVVTEKKICDHNSEGLTEGQSKPKGQQKNKALLESEDMLRTRVVTKLQ